MKYHPEIPQEFIEMREGFQFTPIAEKPVPLDLELLASCELDPALTDEELSSIERWATIFQDYPADKLPAFFYRAVELLGRMWTNAGNENGYFDAVRNLYAFLPEDAAIYDSEEWKTIEFIYYSCQMAQGGNHMFAMMIETSSIASEDPVAA